MAIIGLICIGLVGMSLALFRLQASLQQEQIAQAPAAPVVIPTVTPTPTLTPIPPTPTDTPLPTSTPTLVVNPNAQQAANEQRPTEVVLTANPFTQPIGTPTPEIGTEMAQAPTTEPETEVTPATEPETQAAPTTDLVITPTNTRVIQTPTAMALAPAATPPLAQIPQGGGVLPASDGLLLWAGLGVLLLLIWGLISYLRSPSSLSDR